MVVLLTFSDQRTGVSVGQQGRLFSLGHAEYELTVRHPKRYTSVGGVHTGVYVHVYRDMCVCV